MSNKQKGVLIANPIYDTAFKKLLTADNDIERGNARYFVGTVIGEEITEIDYLPQEYPYHAEHAPQKRTKIKTENKAEKAEKLRLMRLDFVATIRTKSGENKRLLIEVQEAKNPYDLIRFRDYLGEQYKQHAKIDADTNEEIVEPTMPIVVIYVLGFNLEGINTIVMKVNRTYVDLINPDTKLPKNPYVECLTHDSFYIQTARIKEKTYSDWDKCGELLQMLSMFEQNHFVEEKYIKQYPYPITNKNIKKMIETLEYIAADPLTKRLMREEYWQTMNERHRENTIKKQSEKIVTLSDEVAALRRLLQEAGISVPTSLLKKGSTRKKTLKPSNIEKTI
jgi:hypothetical protein